MIRLGKFKPAQGAGSMVPGQRSLHQFRQTKELIVLCQGEVDPFWGDDHLPTIEAKTGERLQRVRPTLGEPQV